MVMKSHLNISRILIRKCFPTFLEALHHHVDIREFSEVGGLFELCRKILTVFTPDYIFDVGSGKRPTFATLMALNYTTEVYAIDPNLDLSCSRNIKRYTGVKQKLSQFCSDFTVEPDKSCLIACNHCHVGKTEILELINKFTCWVYVTVPCCADNRLEMVSVAYRDPHMHSEKKDVYVYSSVQEVLDVLVKKITIKDPAVKSLCG